MSRAVLHAVRLAMVATAYLAAGHLGLLLPVAGKSVSLVWAPSGIAVASALLLGSRVWPAIAFGAFVVTLTTAGPVLAFFAAVGNTAEAMLASLVLRRLRFDPTLDRVRDTVALLLIGCVLAPLVAAGVGAAGLLVVGAVESVVEAAEKAVLWWLGDGVGVLLVAPFVLAWATPSPPWHFERRVEAAALLLLLGGVSGTVFGGVLDRWSTGTPAAFALFPLLVWAALRFGPRMATTANLLAMSIAVAGTVAGVGPFGRPDTVGGLPLLYAFLVQATGVSLLLASTLAERRRADEAVRESERRKDEFIALLDHELRNPLAPVRTALRTLRLARYDPEIVPAACVMMEARLEAVVRLLNGLLDVSRLVRGRFELHSEAVELSAVARAAVEETRARFAERGHRLDVRLPPEPVWFAADGVRLTQALANLLDNAARFTDAGGKVTLEAARDGNEVVITVSDTGIGLSEEALPQLFTPFAQFDRKGGRSQGGLGLGLSLVRGVAELHGGSATARSAGPGRGSTFTIRLPATPARETCTPPEELTTSETVVPAGTRRVLLIEDNAEAATALAGFLGMLNFDVTVAADGEDGLRRAAECRPGAVICDIGLPGMDGYEVARRLRASCGPGLLLVAVTGFSQSDDRRRALDAGFNHHFAKPVDPETLANCLADSLTTQV